MRDGAALVEDAAGMEAFEEVGMLEVVPLAAILAGKAALVMVSKAKEATVVLGLDWMVMAIAVG